MGACGIQLTSAHSTCIQRPEVQSAQQPEVPNKPTAAPEARRSLSVRMHAFTPLTSRGLLLARAWVCERTETDTSISFRYLHIPSRPLTWS